MVLWGLFAVIAFAVVGLEIIALVQHGGARKPLGWSAGRTDEGWVVTEVTEGGPADGLVLEGDRLLAIDGNPDPALVGPRWFLRDSPGKTRYRLTVDRGGVERSFDVPWPVVHDRSEAIWGWIHLFTGVVYLLAGLMVAFARPDSPVARRAVTVTMVSVAFFVTLVLDTPEGLVVPGIPLFISLAYFFVRPLHFVAGYRFNAHFPLGDKSTPGWRRFEYAFYTFGVLLWLPSAYGGALRALGPEAATRWAAAQYPFPVVHDGIVVPLTFLFAGVTGVANGLVLWRNYRLVPPGDLRRRLRWVSIGIVVSLLPIVVVTPLLVLSSAGATPMDLTTTIHIVNVAVILSPICVGYAILKHRVLGIRVVVRRGLQYLLTKNVLRAALAAPLVLVVASIATNPDRTLAELIWGPDGRWTLALVAFAGLALRYRTRVMNEIDRRFFREAYRRDEIFTSLASAVSEVRDVPSLSKLLSSQIETALHPSLVWALSLDPDGAMRVVFASSAPPGPQPLRILAIDEDEVRSLESVRPVDEMTYLGDEGRRVLTDEGVDLLVPVRGPNTGLIGVLLLGEKLSEEPYTTEDRELLSEAAAQAGIVWENLTLRLALNREKDVRRQLTTRIDMGQATLVVECPHCGRCFEGDLQRCPDDGHELAFSLPTTRILDSKYRLERAIGRGGAGVVYEAVDLRLDRMVAVKVVMGGFLDDAVMRERFAREARTSARIVHPNVVTIFDIGSFEGGAYIVLELLQGATLRRTLETGGPLPAAGVARILRAILDGVEAAHRVQTVHRDLKPENVFLVQADPDEPPTPKVLDFGLAVARDAEFGGGERLTKTGAILGTLAYMSPEQFNGDPVDERTDIFSLGIVVLEMITGPLDVRGPTFVRIGDLVEERLSATGPRSRWGPLATALGRAVEQDRTDRFADIAAFREAVLPAVERFAEGGE